MKALDFRSNAGYLIHEADRLMSRQFDRRMRALGLTRAQWWVLAQLYFNDGVTQSELAQELGFSKAALGGLLDRLEAKGWLERRPHATDRRAKRLYRTRLDRGDRATLMRLLGVVIRNLEAREGTDEEARERIRRTARAT